MYDNTAFVAQDFMTPLVTSHGKLMISTGYYVVSIPNIGIFSNDAGHKFGFRGCPINT